MMLPRSARHLSEGELLRLLDADGTGDELARFDAHTAACARCATGLRTLRHAAEVVHTRLQDVQPVAVEYAPALALAGASAQGGILRGVQAHVGTPVWNRGWARAAILLLALTGALVSVRPLRARIRGWVDAAWAGLAGPRPARVAPPAASPAPAAAAPFELSFTPAGAELRVALPGRQAAGTLVLQRSSGSSASLEILPGDVRVVPLASERLLEIRNPPRTRSSYIVRVPASVRTVRVVIGGEAARSFAARALDGGVRLPLALGGGWPRATNVQPAPGASAPVAPVRRP